MPDSYNHLKNEKISLQNGNYIISEFICDSELWSIFIAKREESSGKMGDVKYTLRLANSWTRTPKNQTFRQDHREKDRERCLNVWKEVSDECPHSVVKLLDKGCNYCLAAVCNYAEYSLEDYISNGGHTIDELVRIVCEVLVRLEDLHNREWIHNDVTPRNILRVGVWKLSDLEMATGPGFENHCCSLGTRQYISPEMRSGKSFDARSDLWSVGMILYRILTGSEQPPMGEQDYLNVPEEYRNVVITALRSNPNERYQSAREFREALERIVHSEPMMETKLTKQPGMNVSRDEFVYPVGFVNIGGKLRVRYSNGEVR